MAFLEYLVRSCEWNDPEKVQLVRDGFTRACDHLEQCKLPSRNPLLFEQCLVTVYLAVGSEEEADPECSLLRYWAFIEAKKLNNLTKAREIWERIMRQGRKKVAQWWLSHIQFERYASALSAYSSRPISNCL